MFAKAWFHPARRPANPGRQSAANSSGPRPVPRIADRTNHSSAGANSHQRRTRRTPRPRRIHCLQRLFQRLPIQRPVEPFQKIVGRRGVHHAVHKSKLGIGRRLHISRTFNSNTKFQDFCRDFIVYVRISSIGSPKFLAVLLGFWVVGLFCSCISSLRGWNRKNRAARQSRQYSIFETTMS